MPSHSSGDPRALALSVLIDTDEGSFADARLATGLREGTLSDRDKDLATFLVYGTLSHQLTLDHSIAAFCKRPLHRLDPAVLALLRLGLFQLTFCDRIPAYAAVDRTVSLARGPLTRLRGLINAVLRRAEREGLQAWPQIAELREASPSTADEEPAAASLSSPPVPPRQADWRKRPEFEPSRAWNSLDAAERLGVAWSHPPWLVAMWIEELGLDNTVRLMAENNQASPTALRALLPRDEALAALRERGDDVEAGARAPQAILAKRAVIAPGIAVAQGEASQLVVTILDPQPGDNVLDACAAPGGKTAYIAQLVGPQGRVTAVDRGRKSRDRTIWTLKRGRIPLGPPNAPVEDQPVLVLEADMTSLEAADLRGPFDRILVDAPCSGLGTLRAHPEIRWRREPDDLADLASRQTRILASAARHLKVGGRLVYSTCTVARTENEEVVSDFLEAHPNFAREATAAGADSQGELHTLPFEDGLDGFYAAALTRLS
jgi:16S rRNA (cytosine967-C5)-methyltransferase